jgi:glycosyltransferase involved in cell wall biosynthesis
VISVVIPFFNAKPFILDSVESASIHEIVSEIVVVYDGCPNITFDDLKMLLHGFDKVNIIHHHNLKNYGSGASRNLGIQEI